MSTVLLSKDCAMSAIRIFSDQSISFLSGKSPIIHIVENTHPDYKQDVVKETIEIFLDSIKNNSDRCRFIQDIQMLVLALSLSKMAPIPQSTSESLVDIAAKAGFHGSFPELPKRLLGRDMNEGDITSLISVYVADKSTQCEADEEKLRSWAYRYLSPKAAEREVGRLAAFTDAWNNEIDL